MKDKVVIRKIFLDMLKDIDTQEFDQAVSKFSDQVYLDYESLNEVKPKMVTGEDVVANWRRLLPGFNSTLHVLTNIQITVDDDKAELFSYVSGRHFIEEEKVMKEWQVNGFYIAGFEKINDAWRISKLKLDVKGVLGKRELIELALQRAKK